MSSTVDRSGAARAWLVAFSRPLLVWQNTIRLFFSFSSERGLKRSPRRSISAATCGINPLLFLGAWSKSVNHASTKDVPKINVLEVDVPKVEGRCAGGRGAGGPCAGGQDTEVLEIETLEVKMQEVKAAEFEATEVETPEINMQWRSRHVRHLEQNLLSDAMMHDGE